MIAMDRVSDSPMIYLDHNASTPMAPEVRAVMQRYLSTDFGNPSSGHWASVGAKNGLENARLQVADFLGCDSNEIVFTSGGTEANNLAIKGIWFNPRRKNNHIITTSVEHDAIRKPITFLKKLGAKVTILPVDRFGNVDPVDVEKAVKPETILISVMHANNETGTIQPIEKISLIAKKFGIPFHTDAAQSAGKISTNVRELGVDMLSLASHKIYGPKGVGALFVRNGLKIIPHNHGAGHERGLRGGTESTLLTAGFGKACEISDLSRYRPVTKLRNYFWDELRRDFGPKVHRNGDIEQCVGNTLNVSFENKVGAEILEKLENVAAATGSACHAGCVDMSPVLRAMKVPVHVGMGAIRFSLGPVNTKDEIDNVVRRLSDIIQYN